LDAFCQPGIDKGADVGQRIRIVTDSSCDLDDKLLEELGIEVVSLTVHFGTDEYREGELSIEEFWRKVGDGQRPRTSQPSVGAYEDVFGRIVGTGMKVVCPTLTAKHSGTYNAARLAAERFGQEVRVFDSHSLSLGLGLLALVAARAAREGLSMDRILTLLESTRNRMRVLILLDTLESLRLGGRADTFIAVADRMTRALNIKVLINVVEGQLSLLSAARSFKSGLRRMRDLVEQMGPLEHLAVAHTRNQEMAEEVADTLAQRTGFARERVWIRETGALLAAHGGPGLVAVLALPGLPDGEGASIRS
jgi:DegV family protein with EDD domain